MRVTVAVAMADINDVEIAALIAILSPCRTYMTEQTDWRAKQLPQEAYVSEDLKC